MRIPATVGVDIGSALIKVACLEALRGGWRLVGIGRCPTPPDSVRDGVVINIDEVSRALRQLLQREGLRLSAGVAAVAAPQMVVRQITVPRMPEATLRRSMPLECGKYVSLPVDEVVLGWEEITNPDRTIPEDQTNMELILTAAPKDLVNSHAQTLRNAGLDPLAVDTQPFALHRALFELTDVDRSDDEPRAILDIGRCLSTLMIYCTGAPIVVRTVNIAQESFEAAAIGVLGKDPAALDRFLKSADLGTLLQRRSSGEALSPLQPDEADTAGLTETDEQLAVRALHAYRQGIDELLREVRRSLQFYQSQLPDGSGPQVTTLWIAGGGCSLPGFDAYAGARLGIEVQRARVLDQSALDSGGLGAVDREQYNSLVGVALGCAMHTTVSASRAGGSA